MIFLSFPALSWKRRTQINKKARFQKAGEVMKNFSLFPLIYFLFYFFFFFFFFNIILPIGTYIYLTQMKSLILYLSFKFLLDKLFIFRNC